MCIRDSHDVHQTANRRVHTIPRAKTPRVLFEYHNVGGATKCLEYILYMDNITDIYCIQKMTSDNQRMLSNLVHFIKQCIQEIKYLSVRDMINCNRRLYLNKCSAIRVMQQFVLLNIDWSSQVLRQYERVSNFYIHVDIKKSKKI